MATPFVRMAAKWARAGVLAGSAAILASCQDDSGFGPCLHEYRSSILEIPSAIVAETNEPVSEFVVHSVTLNGYSLEPWQVAGHPPAHGVLIDNGVLRCTVPCGLGTQPGHYVLVIEGGGQPPQSIEVEASYRIFKGGCPSYNDGGTSFSVTLGAP